MKEIKEILLCYGGVVFLLAFALILKIREKTGKLRKEKDFIDALNENRRLWLMKNACSLSLEQYYCAVSISAFLFCVAGILLTGKALMMLFTGVFGICFPDIVIRILSGARNRRFNSEYAKALEQMSDSLKAGLSIALAVKDVVNSSFIDESIRGRFARISSELEMGRTVQESFRNFASLSGNRYAEDVALSIDIQNETGGHEAEVIRDIADGIHERMMLEREIKSIFMETVLTIRVIQLVAPLTMTGMVLILPAYRDIYLSGGVYTAVLIFLALLELSGFIIGNTMIEQAGRGK